MSHNQPLETALLMARCTMPVLMPGQHLPDQCVESAVAAGLCRMDLADRVERIDSVLGFLLIKFLVFNLISTSVSPLTLRTMLSSRQNRAISMKLIKPRKNRITTKKNFEKR